MNVDTIYIEITNCCNLNCHTCYNRSGFNRTTVEMTPEQVETIYLRFRPTRLLLSGGEPTLHSRFPEILKLADTYPSLSLGIVTNATTNSEPLLTALNTHDNITLQVSLDGASEESNRQTRGAGNFEKAMNFIRRIQDRHGQHRLKMVLSRVNSGDVEPFYRLAYTHGMQPEFAFIFRSGNAVDGWEDKSLDDTDKLRIFRQINLLNKQLGGNAFLPHCTVKCPYTTGLEHLSLCIKVDGSVQPCQSLYDACFSVGNVFKDGDDRIEASLQQIVDLARKRAVTDYGCERCLIKDTCSRGCMGAAALITGDPLGNDGECAYRKSLFLGHALKTIHGFTSDH